ncbi:dihydrodipicolinate reductase [Frankia sp. CNm7]|uniref:Dihydrodipicolinate reductase n=1 Tax=Frankia nepalensis TaxID=1836974 RepID=A0A937UPL2_9ACTN|nr:dihydrodipicolinate reductase [Frankia nepalensis]MBL7496636.1 dihydrodipicolinate reductase [Frankia nepalensis]MBL7511894.1 dihydrodipicolinate reductase [Frankia nepalensis]MBL7516645.1 dihydrodipicolinate reductase [Frankia nepalensis]MBL7627375.1 dihydrodipicolinate reductase [Frankia nepalensis]
MPYRVIQWATGNVGTHALRAIIERDDLELVGLRVYDPAKEGIDAGELVGLPPTGILATTDVDLLLKTEADCVNYNALGTTTEDPFGAPLDDICRLLEAGYNVTTSAIDHLVHPPFLPTEVRERIERACEAGGTTLFGSGINPGFTMDLVPITFSRVSRTIDSIHITESLSMAAYTAQGVMRFMGFGQPPDAHSFLDEMHSDRNRSVFTGSLLQVADAIGFEIEDIQYTRDYAVAEEPIDIAIGRVNPGEVAVQRIRFVGIAHGRPALTSEFVWRITDTVVPEWITGDRWIMNIVGDPTMRVECQAETQMDAKRPTSLTVAMAPVNAIPSVCRATPGIKSPLDLPVWGGGRLT